MTDTMVYVVSISEVDGYRRVGIYRTYESALGAWNAVRIAMIWDCEKMISAPYIHDDDHYRKEIVRLSCEDPEELETSIQETPYLDAARLIE